MSTAVMVVPSIVSEPVTLDVGPLPPAHRPSPGSPARGSRRTCRCRPSRSTCRHSTPRRCRRPSRARCRILARRGVGPRIGARRGRVFGRLGCGHGRQGRQGHGRGSGGTEEQVPQSRRAGDGDGEDDDADQDHRAPAPWKVVLRSSGVLQGLGQSSRQPARSESRMRPPEAATGGGHAEHRFEVRKWVVSRVAFRTHNLVIKSPT